MVLLTSRPPRAGQLLPQCARCLSLAARSSTISTSRRHHAPVDRHTTATSQRRSYTRATRSKKEREEKGVNPSEPFDPPPDEPLPADGKHIAIIGGGLTGLTAAYYMAGVVRPSTKITLYEASSRLGGWVKTDQVPVNVDGKKGIVNFERGPRSLSSLAKNKSRFDDLMFYDLVSMIFIGYIDSHKLTGSVVHQARPQTKCHPCVASIHLLPGPYRPRPRLDV